MPQSSQELTEFVVRTIATTAVENEKYFCELDGVVGDGDFGYSLARGFEKVLDEWDTYDHETPGGFLKKCAMAITGRVGGVSGTIWGTMFLRAGMVAGTKTDLTREDVIAMLRSAIEGIKKRGEADLGDKTLLEALIPATDTLEKCFQANRSTSECLHEAAAAARKGAEDTRPMIAKKGRAAYTGERSIGTLDAGAVGVAVLTETLAKDWQKEYGKAAA